MHTTVQASRRRRPGPEPFRQFVVKVNSRCNLACRYCYMYFAADPGWRAQPVSIAPATLDRLARRIAEHAATHRLPAVQVVLHGGEPLLTDPEVLGGFVDLVRAAVPAGCRVGAVVQTNGTLLTGARLRALARHRIGVGLSVDGGLARHNAARVDHAGRPAWPGIRRAARLLASPTHRDSYTGVLSVIDLDTDPIEVYRSLLELDPPAVDFLLPHGNWTSPPPGLADARPGVDRPTPYADWLTTVFDAWWHADRRRVRIRIFEECLAALLRQPTAGDLFGLAPFSAVVVETDGAIEQSDSLKSAYPGAAATGLHIATDPFDAALGHPGVAARQGGAGALAAACRACPLLAVCGGGHYAHRYRAGHGFANPSVYCADLARLTHHLAAAVRRAVPR
ncbi:FxsB family cyclophane-forming radical SAM/SPASM peptide maturase [Streptomyces sp. DSM 44915]|uniref:FxsB family cyclophane-forming radical SAM/SPASM peptide maturase n=1 Tax=Streptomyces chisholmiae TaxID=3075540 RepID=A0ABU2JKY8_9ACTN|nr:FxsB family cyclophane-forming radical SAM/SPASM peptide maturase [Streptomyces sp. DSM 44915]MDT0265647.1 FxsB family cyclophane-forming radical SAM/SPASM peptide maturase [Streptomyces sp. DSM 44915]